MIVLQAKFKCNFDNIKNYPFGEQSCQMIITLDEDRDLIKLKLKNLTYEPYIEVGQYLVTKWTSFTNDRNELRLNLHLQRSTESIFMVTYLPTILMNVINQVVFLIYYIQCNICTLFIKFTN